MTKRKIKKPKQDVKIEDDNKLDTKQLIEALKKLGWKVNTTVEQ